MRKWLIIFGGIFGLTGVLAGAFGAHSLKTILSLQQLSSFETGVRYQLIHAILLLILGFQNQMNPKFPGILAIIGTILFSFSIYLLSLKEFIHLPFIAWLGPITPIGGLLLLSAWAMIIVKASSLKPPIN